MNKLRENQFAKYTRDLVNRSELVSFDVTYVFEMNYRVV